jgi:Inner membrane protein YgaP-like, transmembrane domain
MKTNVGTADRVIRIAVGLVLLSLVFILEGNARWWGLVGLIPLATGLVGWCGAYVPFGIDTSRTGHDASGAARPSI